MCRFKETGFLLFCASFLLLTIVSCDDNQFKMSKVNAVWTKAQKILEGNKLSDLYADLVIHDKKERELKKRKFDGTDSDGLFEADVRRELVNIIKRYGLGQYFPAEKYGVTVGEENEGNAGGKTYPVRDDKLLSILKNARKEGFTDAELQMLKEEMGHYQLKIDEYESLKLEYESLQDQIDNSLDDLDKQENIWNELAKKKQDMKDKHKEYREGLKRLETKLVDKDNSAGVFEDPRVYKLWALAQKAGMDQEELDSIRKELTHFENRIRKAEFIQSQLDKAEMKKQTGAEVNDKEHEELQNRANNFHKKVDKYHRDLSERIHRKLDEL